MWRYADELAEEYKKGLAELQLERVKRKAVKNELMRLKRFDDWTNEMEVDLRAVGSMVSDMEYAIYWLEHAREPGLKRGVTNKSRYQRTELWAEIDILSMQAYRSQSEPGGEQLTFEEETRMHEILSCLTPTEKEAYEYIMGEGHSYHETAEYMGISRSSVQSYVNRAKAKIQKKLDEGKIQTVLF